LKPTLNCVVFFAFKDKNGYQYLSL